MQFEHSDTASFFQCTQCGDCCRGYGGTYVSDADLKAIAAFLNISVSVIRGKYCVLSGKQPVLAQREDGYCIFWEKYCTIHPVKPRMCRQWPFISGLLADINNWQAMAASCPGMRSDVDQDALLACVRAELGISTS